jgi:phage terminase large subunit GpA-like protein
MRSQGGWETAEQREWLAAQFAGLTTEMVTLQPSAWAEARRYLPPSVTPLPGFYRFDVAPYLREIVDCLSVDSPIREVSVMKGVQICATVGILENAIGYCIDFVKNAPVALITADAKMAKLRVDSYITPMLQFSELTHLLKSADEGNKRKSGKALEVSTPIPTPSGFRPIGEIEVGDLVYAADGTAVLVDCVSGIHERECFAVKFANGETIVASDDHRWTVDSRRRGFSERVTLTTRSLYEIGVKRGNDYRFRVPVAGAVAGSNVTLPIAPYTLGAWLGDGTSAGSSIAVGRGEELVLSRIVADGYVIKQRATKPNKCPMYGIGVPGCVGKGTANFTTLLRKAGVLGNKHIPSAYLRASVLQRTELLRGLMDTDGYASVEGECTFTSTSEQLAFDVWSLINSLGLKASVTSKIARAQTGAESLAYNLRFFADRSFGAFALPRKLARQKESLCSRALCNSIVSIEPVGRRTVKCIGVAHQDHLFLCGRGYVPTHNTATKIEWEGGGFLLPLGAQNPAALRSFSAQYILRDEVDGWPLVIGKDGDPLKISADRSAAFHGSRKILDISTPLIKGQSKIHARFLRGDRRRYFVRCLKCSFPQTLKWRRDNKQTGERTGIVWELENGRLIPDSVRYLCRECAHPHTNADKVRLLSPANGAEWQPTAESADPTHRSYHLSALYSPPSMQTWASCVHKWLDAWDVERDRMRDSGTLQVFYNNVLGEPFEMTGEKVRFDAVSAHRRSDYHFGQVPNKFAQKYCGSPVLVLTCSVDVQKDNLAVAVFGWCKDRRSILIDYWRFEGNTEQLDDRATWGRLRELIETKEYVADDGKRYRIGSSLTLIDSGYLADQVYTYCSGFTQGVYPIKGREIQSRNSSPREFSELKTPGGLRGFLLTVDRYKDRISAALRRDWDGLSVQPFGHFNAPIDITDAQLKELTVETKHPRPATATGQESGFQWRRIPGAPNELWDLMVYGHAALELMCWDMCIWWKIDMAWQTFESRCETESLFFT